VLCDAADKRRSAGGTGPNSLLSTMSALERITDTSRTSHDVRFVPTSDISLK
jgi:hypothetical protein